MVRFTHQTQGSLGNAEIELLKLYVSMFADGEEILIQKENMYWTSLVYYENGSSVPKWLTEAVLIDEQC